MRLIAAVALLLTLAIPVDLSAKQETVLDKVRLTGCRATVETSQDHSILESYFDHDNNMLYFGTRPDKLPQTYHDAVIFHEAGHCLQFQEGKMGKYIEIVGRAIQS